MKKYLKYIICASIVITLFFVDMITKILAVKLLTCGEPINILGEFLKLDLCFNPHAGLGLFGKAPEWFLPAMSAVMSVAFIFLIIKFADIKKKPVGTIALCLMLAGTAGNLIDRAFNFPCNLYEGVIPPGYAQYGVVDFVNTNHIFELLGGTFGIWNLADSFLVIGTIALVVHIVFLDKPAKKEKQETEEENVEEVIDSECEEVKVETASEEEKING